MSLVSLSMAILGRLIFPLLLSWMLIFYCLPSQPSLPPILQWMMRTHSCQKLPDRPLRVGVTPWAGFAGGLLANGGFHFKNVSQPLWDSKINKFGVEFVNVDGFDDRERRLLENPCDGVDVLWSTVESWAGEAPRFVEQGIDAKAVMQIAHPTHAHALVLSPNMRDLDDVGRSKLVVPLFSPQHWLLQGLARKYSDVIEPVDSTDAALDEFSGNDADAIAVNECEEYQVLACRRGSKPISNLDGDVTYILVARETSIKEAPSLFKDFIRSWLRGNEESRGRIDFLTKLIHDNPLVSNEPQDQIAAEFDHAHVAGLAENMNMFGLDGGRAAFNKRFKDASAQWTLVKLLSTPRAPEDAKDDQPLLQVFDEHPTPPAIKRLCDPGVNVEMDASPVAVQFETGKSYISPAFDGVLSGIVLNLQTRPAQLCIEGYTDRTGKDRRNKQLSLERAQAVVDSLRGLGVAQGRMFPKGMGSTKPLTTDNQSRRAEIRIVWEGK